jgi:hypothetical protein
MIKDSTFTAKYQRRPKGACGRMKVFAWACHRVAQLIAFAMVSTLAVADVQFRSGFDDAVFTRPLSYDRALGNPWNNDPRVAFVELGIFGMWGEHHSPSPTPAMQALVGSACRDADFRECSCAM